MSAVQRVKLRLSIIQLLKVLVLAALAVGAPASADWGSMREAIRARRQAASSAPDAGASAAVRGSGTLSDALPAGALVKHDLAYGDHPEQKLDVYIPAGAQNAPIILMVHGGAWMMGDKAFSPVVSNKVHHWLPKGYILAAPNYRMSRPPDPLDQAGDVARAMAFVQTNAKEWGGDGARVVLIGHSSGAHLVALLGADPDITARQGAKPWLGVVALDSAALNVVGIMEDKHPRFYDMAFGSDRSHWRMASPFDRLTAAAKPMLLVCSSRRSDSCPAARAFAGKAAALGVRTVVLPVDLPHGGINSELGLPGDYTSSVDSFMHTLGLP